MNIWLQVLLWSANVLIHDYESVIEIVADCEWWMLKYRYMRAYIREIAQSPFTHIWNPIAEYTIF